MWWGFEFELGKLAAIIFVFCLLAALGLGRRR